MFPGVGNDTDRLRALSRTQPFRNACQHARDRHRVSDVDPLLNRVRACPAWPEDYRRYAGRSDQRSIGPVARAADRWLRLQDLDELRSIMQFVVARLMEQGNGRASGSPVCWTRAARWERRIVLVHNDGKWDKPLTTRPSPRCSSSRPASLASALRVADWGSVVR